MKSKFVLASVVVLAAMSGVSAFAGDSDYTAQPINLTSNTTREKVMAEYFQARKDGTLPQMGEAGNLAPPKVAAQPSTVTRAEVRAQAIEWAKTRHSNTESGYGSY